MVLFIKKGRVKAPSIPRPLLHSKRLLGDDLRVHDSLGSSIAAKHVVIVMNGLKEFATELLEWALENIMASGAGYTVTLLGVMPWLNIPCEKVSSKTWQDVWMLDFEHLSIIKERKEWKNDAKFVKLQTVLDLYQKHGVVAQKEVVMRYPLPWLVVERIINLRATWIVFDRDLRKNTEFFAEKIPCNVVMMNGEGGVDMIKGRPMIDNGECSPSESPASSMPTPVLIIPDRLKQMLEEEESEENNGIPPLFTCS